MFYITTFFFKFLNSNHCFNFNIKTYIEMQTNETENRACCLLFQPLATKHIEKA